MRVNGSRFRGVVLPGLLLGAVAVLSLGLGCDDEESPDSTPPPIPSGVYSITGDGYVDVYWDPIRGLDDLAGYGVYRSGSLPGPYIKLASLVGPEASYYRDESVVNGVTYYYAVDAFDLEGNESELSVEDVFDTPRPARDGLRIYTSQALEAQSGVDFSEQPNHSQMLGAWNDPETDIYVHQDGDGIVRAVGVVRTELPGQPANDLQDLGWIETLDDINYAPGEGWELLSPLGVELVEGHGYIVWTWDDHYVKFQVTELTSTYVVVNWAYQVDEGNPELVRPGLLTERR